MIIGLIIIAFVISFWFYRKTVPQLQNWQKWLLLFLRTVAIAIALILLFNPILDYTRSKLTKPRVLLLTDTSSSMQQQGDENSKSELFSELRSEIRAKLDNSGFGVENLSFANGLNGIDNNTFLGKSLVQFRRENELKDLEAIYLFSDGWLKDENLNFLDNFDLPINTFAPDFKYSDFDLKVTNVKFSNTAYKDEIVPVFAQIDAENFSGSATAKLLVNSKISKIKKLNFDEKRFVDIDFDHVFTKAGLHNLEIVVKADSLEEKNLSNNQYPSSIQIRNNKLKCMIVSDKLTWNESFIIKSMADDEHWETVYLNKKGKFYLQDKITDFATELTNANCLIFINHGSLRINSPQADLINNFISKGSGFIFQGEHINNLQAILPSQKTNINRTFEGQIRFSEASKEFNTFRWKNSDIPNNIPPVDYFYVNPKLQAKILATFDNEQQSPAILFQTYEAGKVMQFAFLNLWKWQMWESGNHYKTFMHDLINWFGQQESDRIVANTDRTSYFAGESVSISLKIFNEQFNPATDADALLKLYNDADELIKEDYFTAFADKYQITIEDLQPGKYRFKIMDSVSKLETEGEFSVQDFNSENMDKGINDVLLKYIANTTGGKLYNSADKVEIEDQEKIINKIHIEIPLYTKWYLIAAFLISFCLELFFRKRWGLL
ncbi:MAG: hypothetical protein K9N09_07880 [Candidatus Cloacimonetes bacterium]|nr:hypothetical protein [Candidatus Cloacimonadota bacterium]MCF7815119.1 hypothetical protein [Candidatus Cloacimonadota bacterium]MCF7868602.1 hypothetical protein [Candidatus Cloacimonadota bacterium]MCF7882831.1 hypothetical protein [Candidatus Cloacimonadota bacterium]